MTAPLFSRAAERCAETVLENLSRPYPFASHHTEVAEADLHSPAQLHPAFHTAYDWHSCVHMHWLGASVLQAAELGQAELEPETAQALAAALTNNLSKDKLAAEAAYLQDHPTWERPYGWAWLSRLAALCHSSALAQLQDWGKNLAGCVEVLAENVLRYTQRSQHPIRHGVHSNSAFGLAMLMDAFTVLGREDVVDSCRAAALRWYGKDRNWPHEWELSGHDFLSAGLCEADLMARVLDGEDFAAWFAAFLPGLDADSAILTPVTVADESDGHMVHLHGLNLSRAGNLARIVAVLDAEQNRRSTGDPAAGSATSVGSETSAGSASAAGSATTAGAASTASAAPAELSAVLRAGVVPLFQAGMRGLESEDFMSTHWLASFAWDAAGSMGRAGIAPEGADQFNGPLTFGAVESGVPRSASATTPS